MKSKITAVIAVLLCFLFAACGQSSVGSTPDQPQTGQTSAAGTEAAETASASSEQALPDGTYSADFKTDGSMFHVNEVYDGKGTLTVEGGKMTVHITLPSKNILNLFPGTAEQAQAEGAVLLQPTADTVTYSDGTQEEVNGFDIPVPYLDGEFDCALVGAKGKWYDHKVSVSNPVPVIADGEYTAEVTLSGGSGRASIESPAEITVENGSATAKIVWSSTHYEYMKLGEAQYDRVDTEGNSTFMIPITFDEDIAVSALTTAMSEPHLIDYTLRFDSAALKLK